MELSETKPVHVGLPQGSVLEPTLFKLYMHDFGIKQPVKLAMYALYISHRDKNIALRRLQQPMPLVEDWHKWLKKLNIYKSKAMISREGEKPPEENILTHNHPVAWVKNY